MSNSFFKTPTPQEQLRASKREISGSVRDVDREIATLAKEEKMLMGEARSSPFEVSSLLTLFFLFASPIRSRLPQSEATRKLHVCLLVSWSACARRKAGWFPAKPPCGLWARN